MALCAHIKSSESDIERIIIRICTIFCNVGWLLFIEVVANSLIFQYREIVVEVCYILQKHHPLVKPMTFVGQSSAGKQSKGFTQKQQLKVSKTYVPFSFVQCGRRMHACLYFDYYHTYPNTMYIFFNDIFAKRLNARFTLFNFCTTKCYT
jgi:hypothetical protein